MKKLVSLIKTCMTDNMSLFKIKGKQQNGTSKAFFPVVLAILVFASVWSYANMLMEPLIKVNMEFVLLTIFIFFTSVMTLVEGIYKSSNLLFNCKDDNLLLSLPIKKSTVLFIRILKFYVFELLYNSLFLVPAMVVYARYVSVGVTYYLVSFVAILLLPIIPIVVSCIIGMFISASSTKFKFKNIAQTAITMSILLVVFYISFNLEKFFLNIAEKATSINDLITKIYYPAGAYIKLITNFNIQELLIFIAIHVILFTATIILLSKVYFKINSSIKGVKTISKNSFYKIKQNSPMKALIKKELNRFINSPVFIINAAFGLLLFVVACIGITFKFNGITEMIVAQGLPISIEKIESYIPAVLFGLVCFASLMSSITSSMISLEGKSFNILKSLPIKPYTIIFSKILTAVLIMVPFIFIGDLILFIKFKFNVYEIVMILVSSILLPVVSETIGIVVNLKYPKMDADNDTQVVKQSMSSTVAVFIGMALLGATIYALYKGLANNINVDLIILAGIFIYTIILTGLLIYLKKKSVKEFNKINV